MRSDAMQWFYFRKVEACCAELVGAAPPGDSRRTDRRGTHLFPAVSLTTLAFHAVLAVVKPWAASGGEFQSPMVR
jgi:hypothetical protein